MRLIGPRDCVVQVAPASAVATIFPSVPTAQAALPTNVTALSDAKSRLFTGVHVAPPSRVVNSSPNVPTAQPVFASAKEMALSAPKPLTSCACHVVPTSVVTWIAGLKRLQPAIQPVVSLMKETEL